MEQTDLPALMNQLITGLNDLQDDYEKLFGQHRSLESKLTTARDQYNELAKLLGKSTTDTPPLSLTSTLPATNLKQERPLSTPEILELRNEHSSAQTLRSAIDASSRFKDMRRQGVVAQGVKIWSGPSADASAVSGKLPSITESPMEQDFTVVGVPSKLGCPFASMNGKKLSTHAASVLSRYHGSHSPRDGRSITRDSGSVIASSVSRVNGRDSSHARGSKSRRHSSLVDPIKAQFCGLDSHDPNEPHVKREEYHADDENVPKEGEPGVCPIRFLNQHSPEELAQYFEKHKHELPRSHEVCVKRYQSNEQQVKELDAKYGDVAQMIRGLGEKHQNYLPKDLEDEEQCLEPDSHALVDGRIEKWASSISEQALEEQGHEDDDEEVREPHFSRPLRDVRLGESPSRPWGISIPVQYLEKAGSHTSSIPVQINSSGALPADHPSIPQDDGRPVGTCPFAAALKQNDVREATTPAPAEAKGPVLHPPRAVEQGQSKVIEDALKASTGQSITFTGPIIIGYGPEDAAKFLQSLARSGGRTD